MFKEAIDKLGNGLLFFLPVTASFFCAFSGFFIETGKMLSDGWVILIVVGMLGLALMHVIAFEIIGCSKRRWRRFIPFAAMDILAFFVAILFTNLI